MVGRRYRSKPSEVEAVQWLPEDGLHELVAFAGEKVRTVESHGGHDLQLLAGKDGAQEWVPVPVGHWLVMQPGDPSHIWPVDPEYFASKYDPA